MVALVDVNAQLLQFLHQLLGLLVAAEGFVEAPFGHVQSHWQLKAAEVDKVLWAPVSAPPAIQLGLL